MSTSSPGDRVNEQRHPVEAIRYIWLFHSNSKNPSLFGKTNEQGGIAIAQSVPPSQGLFLWTTAEGVLIHVSQSVHPRIQTYFRNTTKSSNWIAAKLIKTINIEFIKNQKEKCLSHKKKV